MKEIDENIIARVLQGDRNAYALLVDRYKDRVFSLVIGIVRNKELAEELAQDVFLKVYKSLKNFRKESSFSTWIYRIAYAGIFNGFKSMEFSLPYNGLLPGILMVIIVLLGVDRFFKTRGKSVGLFI